MDDEIGADIQATNYKTYKLMEVERAIDVGLGITTAALNVGRGVARTSKASTSALTGLPPKSSNVRRSFRRTAPTPSPSIPSPLRCSRRSTSPGQPLLGTLLPTDNVQCVIYTIYLKDGIFSILIFVVITLIIEMNELKILNWSENL